MHQPKQYFQRITQINESPKLNIADRSEGEQREMLRLSCNTFLKPNTNLQPPFNHATSSQHFLPPNLQVLKQQQQSHFYFPRKHRQISAKQTTPMTHQTPPLAVPTIPNPGIKLLFVEMGVGYDQHG